MSLSNTDSDSSQELIINKILSVITYFYLEKIACKNPQKLKYLTPKGTYPTPNQHQLYTMPSLRVGRSAYIKMLKLDSALHRTKG